jgi:hypothetical protein
MVASSACFTLFKRTLRILDGSPPHVLLNELVHMCSLLPSSNISVATSGALLAAAYHKGSNNTSQLR